MTLTSAWRAAAVTAFAAVVVSGALTPAGAAAPDSMPTIEHAASGVDLAGMSAPIPDRAWQTLKRIDAGQWPPADGSGTKGGATWANREGVLPRTDSSGNPVHYRAWDVNRKQPGHARDAERIATGSDNSAWYSGDALRSFTRMR
ncbi:hypothetical protein DWB77_00225 [Streptomyces hundungensis]|uniref:Uncharacterized protein n=1 Tax=Streptomyces hundungensis TaxID=1077946 RepID=A0A387HBW2_9ACTN|nr:ribonuclease domain-containing protein [Streptomyces hundungensis]AYG78118.1 hypothetical protein DWB77_00225 [Streptomyces hundungensis]